MRVVQDWLCCLLFIVRVVSVGLVVLFPPFRLLSCCFDEVLAAARRSMFDDRP